jgi:nitrous oxidase accessory protein NosD
MKLQFESLLPIPGFVGALLALGCMGEDDEPASPTPAVQATPLVQELPAASGTATQVVEEPATASPTLTSETTPEPTQTVSPTTAAASTPPVALPSQTNAVSAAETATPTPETCGTSLQQRIDAAQAGSVLNLVGCSYAGTVTIDKPLTLHGGTLSSPSDDLHAISMAVTSDNVTIAGWSFEGGGAVIQIVGHSNVQIRNNRFRDHIGGAIGMFGSVSNVTIAGNDIVNTRTRQAGFVGGRASESNSCSSKGRNIVISGNAGDQGRGSSNPSQSVGWFGIELRCFEDVVIEGNSLRGGHVLISLPNSNRVTVRNNYLDITGFAYWAVEVANAHDVVIEGNTVVGDGPEGGDHAFSTNSGSRRTVVRFNNVSDVRTLFDGGHDAMVTDNCLTNVQFEVEFGSSSNQVERNGPC